MQDAILVVDDHPLCAAAIGQVVEELGRDIAVRYLDSIGALEDAAPDSTVKFVLLDLKLPDAVGMQGLERALAAWPDVPICIISAQADAGTIRQVMATGAHGFISKTLAFRGLVRAIDRLLEGERVLPRETANREIEAGLLSPAENRIMKSLSFGLQNKQIAHALGISESTVKSHLAHVFAKLRVQNRAQAIAMYSRLGNGDGTGGDDDDDDPSGRRAIPLP
ncbi:response regulator transcription factor [Novosphingobium aquimarinum]|uniref:response regulator transcription factor n=1 Tax=Novosphingobium aquimarinum TaxID=2682494 RepID=UPI0018DB7A63|nr:response regulator transcription factor [Novosphingobium aquimarinum]